VVNSQVVGEKVSHAMHEWINIVRFSMYLFMH